MNFYHVWNILSWNVFGIKDPAKWPIIQIKIEESNAQSYAYKKPKNGF
jgi:hypothetical protein